jgi:RNA binding exosome subunit
LSLCMVGAIASMHGRVLSHSTERLERVEKAIAEVFGESELVVKHAVGHHGNAIVIIETSTTATDRAVALLRRLPSNELEVMAGTLDKRIDDACNLFVRIDKQRAFLGEIRLATNDDAVVVRMKVRAFPAKKELAVQVVSELLKDVAAQALTTAQPHDSFK